MVSKYMMEKWKRKRNRMIHLLWKNCEDQADVGGLLAMQCLSG